MTKETDATCQLCRRYDNCTKESGSQGCQEYEFYKCETCVDRIIEHDEIPRCFRGGVPCMEVKYCRDERRKKQ